MDHIMSSYKRVATVSTTTSYQRMSTLLDAISAFTTSRRFVNGALKAADAATNPVRISIVMSNQTTGVDESSILLSAGEYLEFRLIDFRDVYVKSIGGTSTLEFEGDEQ